jgi:hypothetical protein
MNFQPDQSNSCVGHQLSLYKVMDLMYVLELFHQIRKSCRQRIPRKHSVVHHGQRTNAEVKKISDLGCAVLESHNSASAVSISLEVDVALLGESKKNLNSCINALFLGSGVQE